MAAALTALLSLLGPGPRAQPAAAPSTVIEHDERGNVRSRSLIPGRSPSAFSYDRLNRLHTETLPRAQSFLLDPNGNRSSDAQASYTVQTNGNRLLSRNGSSWLYDAAGNLLQDQARLPIGAGGALLTASRSFGYNLVGQLQSVSVNGVLLARYAHDAQSLRTRKELQTAPPSSASAYAAPITLYRYLPGGQLSEEIAGSGTRKGQTLVTYVWQDERPLALIYAPNTPSNPGSSSERIVYLHLDALNTPREASDASARIVWRWDSDAYASTLPDEDPDGDGIKTTINLRLPGQYFDAESGLHYNWHRYYDPQSGRYVQSDPIGLAGGINTYTYALGNPVIHTDPDGRIVPALVACAANPACASAALAGAAAVGYAAKNAWDWWSTRRSGPSWPTQPEPGETPGDKYDKDSEACFQECKAHLEGCGPGKDLQASGYRRCFRQCMFGKGHGGLPPD